MPSMSTEMDPELADYFKRLRENDNRRKVAIKDLEIISELKAELGEPDSQLNEYIMTQKLNEEKLDRALTKRGF